MKQTILIHGRPDTEEFSDPAIPSPSNAHWFPWIQKQMAIRDQVAQSLEFPFHDGSPYYDEWVAVIENFKITEDITLVGHSTGGGFILRYLSEHPEIKLDQVILVAPWLDPKKILSTDFMNFAIDPEITNRVQVHAFSSSDDMKSVVESCATIKEKLPGIKWHEFTDREHFCTKEFPELLEILT